MLAAIGRLRGEAPLAQTVQTVWLIDTVGRKVVYTMPMPEAEDPIGRKIRFTPDGKQVVSLMSGGVRVWDAKTGNELIRQPTPRGIGTSATLAISPDGKTIAFGRNDVYLWRWATGEEPRILVRVSPAGTDLMAFAPDGTLYIAGRGPLQKWDITTDKQVGTLDVGGLPRSLAFSSDGKTLAAGYARTSQASSEQCNVRLWDVATVKRRDRLSLGHEVRTIDWSSDGTRLAAGTTSRLWAWDVKTGRPLGTSPPGHEASISSLAFGPDGTLFTGGDDHTVRSWHPATGRPGLVLTQDHWVRGIAVSLDGSLVAGSALSSDLRIWDAKTGAAIQAPGQRRFGGGVRLVGFTADGARLVAWGDDECLRVWDTRTGKLLVETRPNGEAPADPLAAERRLIESALSGSAAISPDGLCLRSPPGLPSACSTRRPDRSG